MNFDEDATRQARDSADLVPGGGAHVREGTRSVPAAFAAGACAGTGVPRLGPRRQRVHRVRHGAACRSVWATPIPPVVEARARVARPRYELHPAVDHGAGVRRTISRVDRQRRHGEVHQGRLDRHDRRAEDRAQGDRSRHGGRVRRSSVLLVRRLVHVDDHGRWWHVRRRAGTDGLVRVQRPRIACERLFERTRNGLRRSSSNRRGPTTPVPGFLEGVRSLCDAHGAVLVFDEMITGFRYAPARRAAAVRRDARSLDLRKGTGERILGLGAGRAAVIS